MGWVIKLILDLYKGKQLKDILKLSKLIRLPHQELIKIAYKDPDKLGGILQKKFLNNVPLKREFTKLINNAKIPSRKYKKLEGHLDKYTATKERDSSSPYDFSLLSSSWIMNGSYASTTGDRGILTLDFDKAKHPYTYFNVPLKVWEHMKEARGKYGDGAGTVFWREYLRKGGSWKSYNAIEFGEAINTITSKRTMLRETKTYHKMMAKYKKRRTWRVGGISQFKGVVQTKKRIYNQRLGIIRARMKNKRR